MSDNSETNRKNDDDTIEKNRQEFLLLTRSFWPKAVSKPRYGSRVVIVMRSAERVDRIFGRDWKRTEAPTGKYHPTDLNLPAILKKIEPEIMVNNSPITTMGKYRTQLVARALHNRGLAPATIYCSPALRSIQTAAAIATYVDTKIMVEPGLLEPGVGKVEYGIETLAKIYPIDLEYSPIVSLSKIKERKQISSATSRMDCVLRNLAALPHSQPVLIVGHGMTMRVATDIGQDTLIGGENESSSGLTSFEVEKVTTASHTCDPVELGVRYPPGSVLTLVQNSTAPPIAYRLSPNLVPPLTYGKCFSTAPILNQ